MNEQELEQEAAQEEVVIAVAPIAPVAPAAPIRPVRAPVKPAAPAAPAVPAPPPEPQKLSFDTWWALREKLIAPQHRKEIVKVDFKSRKVPMQASMADFDAALKKYGVEL